MSPAAFEATTGWRFLVSELEAAGHGAHLAEPAETAGLRGPKRRAKTDRADARHLRTLLSEGRLPESWIPPEHILELRSLVRLRKALVDERCTWQQRIHAQLYHHGSPSQRDLLTRERRAWVESLELPQAARTQVSIALSSVDHIRAEMAPLEGTLREIARSGRGTRALQAHYGIGQLTAVAILAARGDATRFSSSRKVILRQGPLPMIAGPRASSSAVTFGGDGYLFYYWRCTRLGFSFGPATVGPVAPQCRALGCERLTSRSRGREEPDRRTSCPNATRIVHRT